MMQRPAFQMSSSRLLPAGMPEGALQDAGGGCHQSLPRLWSLCVTLLPGQASVSSAMVAGLV